jgi:hypothetical protein
MRVYFTSEYSNSDEIEFDEPIYFSEMDALYRCQYINNFKVWSTDIDISQVNWEHRFIIKKSDPRLEGVFSTDLSMIGNMQDMLNEYKRTETSKICKLDLILED